MTEPTPPRLVPQLTDEQREALRASVTETLSAIQAAFEAIREALTNAAQGFASFQAAFELAPPPEDAHAPEVVAYRSRGGRLLRCRAHHPGQEGIDSGDFHPVTSEDLPDGGVCTWPTGIGTTCGVDVLIPITDSKEPSQ